jgi:hypothetical protein
MHLAKLRMRRIQQLPQLLVIGLVVVLDALAHSLGAEAPVVDGPVRRPACARPGSCRCRLCRWAGIRAARLGFEQFEVHIAGVPCKNKNCAS